MIGGAVWAALLGFSQWPITDISEGVLSEYVELVREGSYGDAYDKCLSASYRSDISKEDFTEEHRKLETSRGKLQAFEVLRVKYGRNVFTGVRSMQLLCLLRYSDSEFQDYVEVNDRDGEWRIDGTYILQGRGLLFKVW